MKKIVTVTMMVFILLLSGIGIYGQEKSAASKKAEQSKIEEKEFDEQAKVEQARAKAEQSRAKAEQARAVAELNAELSAGVRSSERIRERSSIRSSSSAGSSYFFSDDEGVHVISDGSIPGVHYMSSGSSSSSNLNLSKSYNGETKENSGTFQVDESVRHISLNINGNVKSGSITIKILLSNGKVFKEVKLDDSAYMSFSQSIRISDEEKKYYGDWKYIIKAEKAEGKYVMQIQTH